MVDNFDKSAKSKGNKAGNLASLADTLVTPGVTGAPKPFPEFIEKHVLRKAFAECGCTSSLKDTVAFFKLTPLPRQLVFRVLRLAAVGGNDATSASASDARSGQGVRPPH